MKHLTFLIAVILCCSSIVAQPSPKPEMGLNLSAPTDWNSDAPFSDMMHGFRRWGQVNSAYNFNPQLQYKEGLPTSSAAAFSPMTEYPDGLYTLTFSGTGNVTVSGNLSEQSRRLDNSGITTAQIKATGGGPAGAIVSVMPPIDSVHLYLPGYDATSSPWRSEYLGDAANFTCLRLMDSTIINGSLLSSWDQRPQLTWPIWTTFDDAPSHGIPYEALIQLCASAKASPWLCIPDRADDNFIRQLAALALRLTPADTKIRFEYSNECWNTSFSQRNRILSDAHNNPQVQGQGGDFELVARQVAWQCARIRSLVGNEPRIEVVLGAWASQPFTGQASVDWLRVNAPGAVQAVAIAPYIGDPWTTPRLFPDPAKGVPPPLTADQAFDEMQAATQDAGKIRGWIRSYKAMADSLNARLYAYEGGPSLGGSYYGNLFLQMQRMPKMGDTEALLFKTWKDEGGSLFVFYHHCGPWSPAGEWGAKERLSDNSGIKWVTLKQTAADCNKKPTTQPVVVPPITILQQFAEYRRQNQELRNRLQQIHDLSQPTTQP